MAEETSLLSLDRFEQAFSALSLAERRLVLERCLQGCSLSEIVTVTEVCRPHLKFCDFFSMLPQLVVSMILDYLPLRDLVSCAQVSKNWESALTETRSLWLRAKPWPCPKPLVTDGHPYPIARYELQRWARLDHRNGGGIEIRDLCWGCDGTVKPIMAFTWNRDRLLVAFSRDDDKVGIFDLEAHCKPPCAGRPKTSIPLSSSFPLGALESCDYAKIFGQSELVMAPFRRPFLVSVSIVNFQTSSPLRRYCGHASDVVDFAKLDNFLFSVSSDRTVKIWNYQETSCLVSVQIDADLRRPSALTCRWYSLDVVEIAVAFKSTIVVYRVSVGQPAILPSSGAHVLFQHESGAVISRYPRSFDLSDGCVFHWIPHTGLLCIQYIHDEGAGKTDVRTAILCTQQSLPDMLCSYTFHIAPLPRGVGVMILLESREFWCIGVVNLPGGEMDRAEYYGLDDFGEWFEYLAYDNILQNCVVNWSLVVERVDLECPPPLAVTKAQDSNGKFLLFRLPQLRRKRICCDRDKILVVLRDSFGS